MEREGLSSIQRFRRLNGREEGERRSELHVAANLRLFAVVLRLLVGTYTTVQTKGWLF